MNTPTSLSVARSGPTPLRLSGPLLAVLAGLAALGALSTNIILPALPRMASDLRASTDDVGWVQSGFFLAFAVGQLFVGPVSDRWGRRAPVLGGLALFIAGSVLCAWAPTLPLLGSAMEYGPGWCASFALVALLGLLLALAYMTVVGETHPSDRRAATTPGEVLRGYAALARDARFISPAFAVSVIIGGLYAFFAATPAVLMGRMGLSALQLGLFFAGTVFVVFAAGMLAPRLAHRWGAARVAGAGCVVALVGALALLVGAEGSGLAYFTGAVVLYLLGMGLVNPLGTAMALGPFSRQAGLASSLLGALQMACAGGMTALASLAGRNPAMALGLVLTAASVLALAALTVRRQR
ncbi:MFS transporter [Polaromonas jejuensis]|uniref:MFS transporter n=1 Tax=Polaromonas jejuensis TaxID=457502 RepID=A0ABW0QHT6_9BURK|nr:MFS transporter [Polaromonas jejuensis]